MKEKKRVSTPYMTASFTVLACLVHCVKENNTRFWRITHMTALNIVFLLKSFLIYLCYSNVANQDVIHHSHLKGCRRDGKIAQLVVGKH